LTAWEGISEGLPSAYAFQHSARAYLATRRDAAQELARSGYGLDADGNASISARAGRKPLLELSTTGGVLLVRRFSHGGLLRFLTGSRFADPKRPIRELCLSALLRERGVRTPEVVAARAQRAAGFGWRLDLVTRCVPDTIDLGRLLGMARRGELNRITLRRVVRAAGAFVRSLHDQGCLHADLTPNNMLVEHTSLTHGDPVLWIVDLEGARIAAPLGDLERRRNLGRLMRFVARREERHGHLLTRADFARFMRGYDPQGRSWKDDWLAIQRDHTRNSAWHRVGWFFESLWRQEPDRRETADARAPVAGRRAQS
jgi:hypothetical protein